MQNNIGDRVLWEQKGRITFRKFTFRQLVDLRQLNALLLQDSFLNRRFGFPFHRFWLIFGRTSAGTCPVRSGACSVPAKEESISMKNHYITTFLQKWSTLPCFSAPCCCFEENSSVVQLHCQYHFWYPYFVFSGGTFWLMLYGNK